VPFPSFIPILSLMDQDLVTRIVEAALLAANQPLTLAQLHALFSLDEPAPDGSVERALEALREACADRGVELVEVASGFRYQVKADVHGWVARLWTERKTKYTRATLETLALIAYRQPITRGEIEQVRGVAVSSNIIQALEEREWIRVVGHRDVPGKPALYGTTKGFLDYFGLKRLDELPPLSELKDIGELEPQLQFDGDGAMPVGGIAEPNEERAADDRADAPDDIADEDAHAAHASAADHDQNRRDADVGDDANEPTDDDAPALMEESASSEQTHE
jgi:segregation and condensation protein B